MKVFFILTMFLMSLSSFSYDLQGQFENVSKESVIKEGSVFKAYLRIWPFEGHSLDDLKDEFESKTFLNFFYVVDVTSINYSQNNSEVLEVYMNVILKKHFKTQAFYIWSFRSVNIPIELVNIQTAPIKKSTQISIMESEYRIDHISYLYFYILGIIILIIVLTFIYKKKILKEKEVSSDVSSWNDRFLAANSRSDFEKIYKERELWLNEIGGLKPVVKAFFDSLNEIQYKKEWSDDEMSKVRDSFIEIREIFKK